MSVLEVALDPATVIVAVDPGKAFHRVWISNGVGLLADPMSLSVSREGISQLELALNKHGPDAPVIAIEATGSLRRPWVTELERRHPGSIRLFAPSETKSARIQLGFGQVQDRRSRLRGVDVHGLPRWRSALRPAGLGGGAACRGPTPTRSGGRPQGRSAAVARPTQCLVSWIVGALGSRSILGAGDADRQRVWRPRSISRPPCSGAVESRDRDWPSTVMP